MSSGGHTPRATRRQLRPNGAGSYSNHPVRQFFGVTGLPTLGITGATFAAPCA